MSDKIPRKTRERHNPKGLCRSHFLFLTINNIPYFPDNMPDTFPEETDREKTAAADNNFGRKALMLPAVFVIKAKKG